MRYTDFAEIFVLPQIMLAPQLRDVRDDGLE
jgi:hypothetical protein